MLPSVLSIPSIASFQRYLPLIVVYLVWGTTFCAIHFGVQTIPPQTFIFIRFFVSGLLLLGLCRLMGERWPAWPELKKQCLIGFLMLFCGNSIVCWAVKYLPTGLGAMLMATTPFWMMGLSALMPPREKIQPMALAGLMVGFLGLVILFSPQMGSPSSGGGLFWLSVFSLVGMAFFWALGSILIRKDTSDTPMLMAISIQNLFASLMLLPICLAIPGSFAFAPSMSSLLGLGYLIVISSVVATWCYLHILKTLPVSISSTFAYVTPLISLAIGIVFLHEPVSLPIFIGSAFILLGIGITQGVPVLAPLMSLGTSVSMAVRKAVFSTVRVNSMESSS